MRRFCLALAMLPACALAQNQVVKPPIAQYWMSVETAAGMSMPGMNSAMAGMMGGQASSGRKLALQLGSDHGGVKMIPLRNQRAEALHIGSEPQQRL